MANWKREIKNLCNDFGIARKIYEKVVNETENNIKETPKFYNGNNDDYMYDVAYNHIKPYILGI